jgi:hypothetical protein
MVQVQHDGSGSRWFRFRRWFRLHDGSAPSEISGGSCRRHRQMARRHRQVADEHLSIVRTRFTVRTRVEVRGKSEVRTTIRVARASKSARRSRHAPGLGVAPGSWSGRGFGVRTRTRDPRETESFARGSSRARGATSLGVPKSARDSGPHEVSNSARGFEWRAARSPRGSRSTPDKDFGTRTMSESTPGLEVRASVRDSHDGARPVRWFTSYCGRGSQQSIEAEPIRRTRTGDFEPNPRECTTCTNPGCEPL